MSQSGGDGTQGSGGGGDDGGSGGGDKKRKGIAAERGDDHPMPFISSDEDSDQKEEDPDQARRSSLNSLSPLEDALPFKKGLSTHYKGKSKSFGSLTDLAVSETKDLAKKEHPLNKKRRLHIVHDMLDQGKLGGSSAAAVQPAGAAPSAGDNIEEENEEDKKKDEDKAQEGDDN